MKTALDLVAEARFHITEIPLAAAEDAIHDADVLIDVREPEEYQAGHIPGALLIPRGLLEFKIGMDADLAPRDTRIVLYCKTSGRATLCAHALQQMGYHHVKSIAGGFDAWQASGRAVITLTTPRFD